MNEVLQECKLQLEYLNEKFGETGTTNAVLAKIASLPTPSNSAGEVVSDAKLYKQFEQALGINDLRVGSNEFVLACIRITKQYHATQLQPEGEKLNISLIEKPLHDANCGINWLNGACDCKPTQPHKEDETDEK